MAKYNFKGDADPNVIKVIGQILDRSRMGLRKYGTDTTRGDFSKSDWLQHLQEELWDASIYAAAHERALLTIKVKLNSPNARLPAYKTTQSAGADLASVQGYNIEPDALVAVRTGLAFEPPEGVPLDLRVRSSLAMRSVILATGVGTIDSDYRGEVLVPLLNLGTKTFSIVPGDRVAQLLLPGGVQGIFEQANTLNNTERGAGGFGSTGK